MLGAASSSKIVSSVCFPASSSISGKITVQKASRVIYYLDTWYSVDKSCAVTISRNSTRSCGRTFSRRRTLNGPDKRMHRPVFFLQCPFLHGVKVYFSKNKFLSPGGDKSIYISCKLFIDLWYFFIYKKYQNLRDRLKKCN